MHPIVFLPLLVAIVIAVSACGTAKGGIVILENPNGTGCTMEFSAWSARNKCELALDGGDVLQIKISRESGAIGLTISGKNGGEPYTGNDLWTGTFTVAVSETDEYVIAITGDKATGSVAVRNLGGQGGRHQ